MCHILVLRMSTGGQYVVPKDRANVESSAEMRGGKERRGIASILVRPFLFMELGGNEKLQ